MGIANTDLRWNHSFIQQTCINGLLSVSSYAGHCELNGGLTQTQNFPLIWGGRVYKTNEKY